ncbi:DNA-deoxyinosine glycosylase [Sphingomonas sp.]|uniref:DNA-deoxyinosine glycosylase n=1 Tax=Sphingomonas sp. TaxID=28214 RepID=UPI00286CEAB4|nr:DNA-deoxyinosine glycosylase [Sphingomonas sp.]
MGGERTESAKIGLPPVARADATLFILGSLPGDVSLSAQRYYAHPTNQFWRLVGSAVGEDLDVLSYEERLRRLADRRIGLWDVIASASRRGSLDQAIRSPAHNQVERLRHKFPELRALAFNGATAAATGRRLVGVHERLRLIDLPSSSAANTLLFAEKARVWAVLAQFVA